MNPDTNQFYVGEPQGKDHIPFEIGEEVIIKGHVFAVELVDIPKNPTMVHLLVLRPIRKAEPRTMLKATADMADPPLA
jgi:hypothetical protein